MGTFHSQRSSDLVVFKTLFVFICLFIQFSNCVENSKKQEDGLPQDILDAILTSLEDSPKELSDVLLYLSSGENLTRHLKTLRTVMGNKQAFRNILEDFAKDAKDLKANLKEVAIAAGTVTYTTYLSIRQWYKGEISGVRCTKIVVDELVGAAAGVGGGFVGEAIGAYLLPGYGPFIEAFAGGMFYQTAADIFSDWANEMIFNLPKDVALENAYNFVGLPYDASYDEIDSRFRKLILKYHPDKGGNEEDWFKLQTSMTLIKVSKEGVSHKK